MARYPQNTFVDSIERDVIRIDGERHLLRYVLTLDNMESESEKTVTVIHLHPMGAEQQYSDAMTNQMVRFLSKEDFQSISFVTLFPYHVPTATQLRELIVDPRLEEVMEKNRRFIHERLMNSDVFVLAWGERPYYIPNRQFDEAFQYVMHLIQMWQKEKNVYVFRYSHAPSFTKNGQPDTPQKKVIEGILPIHT